MNFVTYLFKFLASTVSLYAFICVIRIFITWIPNAQYSKIGSFLRGLCDPWLNSFKKFNPTKNIGIDFSPIISIGILYIISNVFQQIATTKSISFSIIITIILQMAWSIVSSLLIIFGILVVLRLLSYLFNWTNPFWYNLDTAINPVSTWIRKTFLGNRFVKPTTLLTIIIVSLFVINFLGKFFIGILSVLILRLPF